jgi:RluA family pseudouridine synthase
VIRVVATGDETLVHLVAVALRDRHPSLPISNADARRVVVARAVRVNGLMVTRPGAMLRAGDRVAIAADPGKLARARRAAPEPVRVIFADAHVVVVDKPAGLPTHATADPGRLHLVAVVARQLGIAEAALGVHQRLDAGTSGVVVFGRSSQANRGLAQAFAARDVEKVYLAVVEARGRPDLAVGHSWTSRGMLAAAGVGKRGRHIAVRSAGQGAETAFVVRTRRGDRVLLEARPKTGRQHQIRAHLAAEGVPIVGDTRYGGPAAGRLHLHAWRLRLAHPVTGASLRFEAPSPEEWP